VSCNGDLSQDIDDEERDFALAKDNESSPITYSISPKGPLSDRGAGKKLYITEPPHMATRSGLCGGETKLNLHDASDRVDPHVPRENGLA
jgi:hypothetical protein